MNKNNDVAKIGIIAEDQSDTDTLEILIKRILPKKKFSFKSISAKGCAKIPHKGSRYSKNLKDRGCAHLIIIRDSDKHNPQSLKQDLEKKITPKHIDSRLILIPVQELESWLLADTSAIHKCFSKEKKPSSSLKEYHHPETVDDPKECLGDYVYRKYHKIYLNTAHNKKIAEISDLKKLKRKCPSFSQLHEFISAIK